MLLSNRDGQKGKNTMTNFDKKRKGSGTNEWAEEKRNIGRGCEHNCVYCYAHYDQVVRFQKIKPGEWTNEIIIQGLVDKDEPYVEDSVFMFPTQHDITPYYYKAAMTKITKILKSGNELLIVSKPHLDLIKNMTYILQDFKDKILFRFSISTIDDKRALLWEPGAPTIQERLAALQVAFERGYKTSISAEPMFPAHGSDYKTSGTALYFKVLPHLTDTIWFGKLNKIRQRVKIGTNGITEDDIKRQEAFQCDYEVLRLVDALKEQPKVRWKESISAVIPKRV